MGKITKEDSWHTDTILQYQKIRDKNQLVS